MPRSSRLLGVLDALTPQLSYANPKVNLAALAAVEGAAPVLGHAMAPAAAGIVQALAGRLASANTQVRGGGGVSPGGVSRWGRCSGPNPHAGVGDGRRNPQPPQCLPPPRYYGQDGATSSSHAYPVTTP